MRTERQSRRIVYQLRKCTRQEDGSILRPRASLPHQEHYILPALQRRLDLGKVFRIVYRLFVDFQNHVATIQANVFGERLLFHVRYHHAFAGGNAEPVGEI